MKKKQGHNARARSQQPAKHVSVPTEVEISEELKEALKSKNDYCGVSEKEL